MEKLNRYISHLKYILAHKWYILRGCFKMGLYWRGMIHDFSKFLPSEFFVYARNYVGSPKDRAIRGALNYYDVTNLKDGDISLAVHKHYNRNRHHWQWWIARGANDKTKALQMPIVDAKEMLIDWYGARKAQAIFRKTDGSISEWYGNNYYRISLHPRTRAWVDNHIIGIEKRIDPTTDYLSDKLAIPINKEVD